MLILLSHLLDEKTPIYGGRKGFLSNSISSISSGDTTNTSSWIFPNHIGTHIDLPYHFFNKGKSIESYPVDHWFVSGENAAIIEIPIEEDLLKPSLINTITLPETLELIMIKTGFTDFRHMEIFWRSNPGISTELGKYLIKKFPNLRFIGIDSISISSWKHRNVGRLVHKMLLDPVESRILIEDMNLSQVDSNTVFKWVIISPLMVKNSDGSPCTIFAEVK